MPLSSKRIIQSINMLSGSFSRQDLITELVEKKIEKNKARKGKDYKKKPAYKSEIDISRIDDTVSALFSAGFLKKNKKRYTVLHKLHSEGTISINSSGNGIVKTFDGDEIVIQKDKTNNAHNNDHVSIRVVDYRKGVFFGEVRHILQRDKNSFMAKYTKKTKGFIYYTLLDMPGNIEVCLDINRLKKETGSFTARDHLYLVTLEPKFVGGRQLCIVENFLSMSDEDNDLKRIRIKHSLPEPHKKYKELKNIRENIPETEFRDRKDYRKHFTVTIDGADAKDFDDAISIRKIGQKTKLYVHIADVSAYVKARGELDMEALSRGTSCYLGNNVIPMLPEELSNDLCSLKEGVDRLTLTAEMTFNSKGDISECDFHRGIIKVKKRLTYDSADTLIGKKAINTLSRNLKQMYILAKRLNKKRSSEGRLDLNLTDEELVFENNRVVEIREAKRLRSHMLVEEFMLSANETVSKAIKENGIPSLYRTHEEISDEKLYALKQFLKLYSIRLNKAGNRGMNIQKILQEVSGREYEHVVSLVVLKSMMQAYYGIESLGHFGLGFDDYTHFTSPIRRYPDLIVHRCLKSLIDKSPPPYTAEELIFIGEKSSEFERIAQKAERDMTKLKSCRLMKPRTGETFMATITGIAKSGFFVTLKEIPIEGMVPLRALTDDYYLINEDDYTIIGRKYSRRFRLGDSVKVRLASVEIELMRIDFEPV